MKEMVGRIRPFREYVLSECERQWKDCQESDGYGQWGEQDVEEQKRYFEDMYWNLWSERFELDCIELPEYPERDAWELLHKRTGKP